MELALLPVTPVAGTSGAVGIRPGEEAPEEMVGRAPDGETFDGARRGRKEERGRGKSFAI